MVSGFLSWVVIWGSAVLHFCRMLWMGLGGWFRVSGLRMA